MTCSKLLSVKARRPAALRPLSLSHPVSAEQTDTQQLNHHPKHSIGFQTGLLHSSATVRTAVLTGYPAMPISCFPISTAAVFSARGMVAKNNLALTSSFRPSILFLKAFFSPRNSKENVTKKQDSHPHKGNGSIGKLREQQETIRDIKKKKKSTVPSNILQIAFHACSELSVMPLLV